MELFYARLYSKIDYILHEMGTESNDNDNLIKTYKDDNIIIIRMTSKDHHIHYDIQNSDGSPSFSIKRKKFVLDDDKLEYIDILYENAKKKETLRESIIKEARRRITMANEIADSLYAILFYLNNHFTLEYSDENILIKAVMRGDDSDEFGLGIAGYEVYDSDGVLVFKSTNHYIRDYYDLTLYRQGSWEKCVLNLGKLSSKNYEAKLYSDYVRARKLNNND